jgi:hypothetical protein
MLRLQKTEKGNTVQADAVRDENVYNYGAYGLTKKKNPWQR